MLIAGVNLGSTKYGKHLKDGGTCVIENGKILSIIPEERISRKKHSGGFKHSLDAALRANNIHIGDIDLFVCSSCCEPIRNNLNSVGLKLNSNKLSFVNHHLSHAASCC